MQRREWLWVVVGLLALGLIVWVTFPRNAYAPNSSNLNVPSNLTNVQVREQDFDRPMTALSLQKLDGTTVSLTPSSQEPAMILVFWRTDCQNCLRQLEEMSSVVSSGRMYAINVGESEETVRTFLEEHPQTATIVLDPLKQSTAGYATESLPSSTFIHSGTIVGFGTGLLTRQQLESKLSTIGALE